MLESKKKLVRGETTTPYTDFVWQNADYLSARCSLRQLVEPTEVEQFRRHEAVWRRRPEPPFLVCESAARCTGPAVVPTDTDLIVTQCCRNPGVRLSSRLAAPGTLCYVVCSARAIDVLCAHARPFHAPVDVLLEMLADLGDLRMIVLPDAMRRSLVCWKHWWDPNTNVQTMLFEADPWSLFCSVCFVVTLLVVMVARYRSRT